MKYISHISIPTPCTQKWGEMQPNDDGRFCNYCQKTVIDFTKLSNSEIISTLSSSSNVCGKIDQSQLSSLNNSLAPKYRIPVWPKAGLLAAVISLVPFVAAKAQVKLKVEQHKPVKPLVDDISAKVPFTIITGNVLDSASNQPVAFVTVNTYGSHQNVLTDSLGNFKIDILSDVDTALILTAVGYQIRSINLIAKQTNYHIQLSAQNMVLKEEVFTHLVGGIVAKRSLLRSVWYHIKQPFRRIFN